jgi:poly(A) polymerase
MRSVSPLQPTIIPRSEHSISRKWISPNALRVLYRLKETGHHAYLVGGGVRDLLLGREPKDFDIATDATPGEMKKLFRNCRLIGRRFRLAHVHFHNEIIEVATFRSNITEESVPVEQTSLALPIDSPSQDLNPPFSAPSAVNQEPGALARPRPPRMLKTDDGMILRDNVFGTPEEDALRRDFTVNAMFYNVADFSVIDYVGGMKDLRQGLIRIIGDPAVRFIEDPVRMVRAVRFAAMLGFEIEDKTYAAMLELKDRLALASPSRMYEEVQKLFMLGEAEKTYQMLRHTGLFGVIFPRLNEWVDIESEGFPHIRISKALDWVDASVQSGKPVPPPILFALLYGQYVEEKTSALGQSGVSALDAVTSAVAETFAEQTQRVQIPKKVGLAMRDIYWNQQRFEKREGKYPRYFLHRPGFSDAYEYLRFISEATGEKQELCAWWTEFIKANPLPPVAPGHEKKGRKPPEKALRKRRRRRPRNKAGETKPKL